MALANFYWSLGRRDEAGELLKRIAEREPLNIGVQRALAAFYLSTGRADLAQAPLKAIDAASKTVSSRIALADFYLAERRDEDGLRVLTEQAATGEGFARSEEHTV